MDKKTIAEMIDYVRQAVNDDPLTQRGVGRDWHCVAHTRHRSALIEIGAEYDVAGRRLWFFSDAPEDAVEFLSPLQMMVKYHHHSDVVEALRDSPVFDLPRPELKIEYDSRLQWRLNPYHRWLW